MFNMRTFYLALCCLFVSQVNVVHANQTFEKAQIAFQNHQYNDAKVYLKQLLSEEPNNLSAKLLMAQLLIAQGNGHLAETEIKQMMSSDIDKSRLILHLAQAYILQSKYNETLSLLASERLPNLPRDQVLVMQGLAKIGLGHYKLAKADFNDAVTLNSGNLDAKLGVAQLHLIEHNYVQAERVLNEVTAAFLPPLKAWAMLATVYINRGELDRALAAANAALNENENDINSLAIRASVYIQQDKLELADHDIETGLNVNEFEPRFIFLKAVVASRGGNKRAAEQALKEINSLIEHFPTSYLNQHPSYYYLASFTYFLQNNLELAQRYITSYLDIDAKSVRAMRLSAAISLKLKDYTSAISALNKAYLVKSDDVIVLTMLGSAYLAQNNQQKALLYFKEAHQLAPDNAELNLEFAKALVADKQLELAIATLQETPTQSLNAEVQTELQNLLVYSYLRRNDIDSAISIVEQQIEQQPDNAEYIKQAGMLWRLKGDQKQALSYLERAATLDPQDMHAHIEKAQLLFANHQAKQAVELLVSLAEQHPHNAELLLALSTMYRKVGAYQQSYTWAEKAYLTDTNNFELVESFALLNVFLNQANVAIDIVTKFADANEKTYAVYALLGELYRFNRSPQKAIDTLQQAFKLSLTDKQKSANYLKIAQSYSDNNDNANAVVYYKRAIAWDRNANAISALINLYRQNGKFKQALDTFIAHQKLLKDDDMVMLHGQVLIENAMYQQAIDVLDTLPKQQVNAQVAIAHIYITQNKLTLAKERIETALALTPNNPVLNMSLAEVYIKQQDWAPAQSIYQQLISAQPTPTVLNNAAYIALQLEEYAKARELAQQAVDANGQSPNALDTLGQALYFLKEYQTALPHFRKALAIDNNRADIKYHIAKTLIALNREKEAVSFLAEAVNSAESFDDKTQAIELLKTLTAKSKS